MSHNLRNNLSTLCRSVQAQGMEERAPFFNLSLHKFNNAVLDFSGNLRCDNSIMMPVSRPVIIRHIAVELPLKRIYTRLGYRKASTRLTETDEAKIRRILDDGLLACELSGVYVRKRIERRGSDQVVLDDGGIVWHSRKLAQMLADSQEVFALGATAGEEIVTARDQAMERGNTLTAVLFDALASEMVESAVQWLHDSVAKMLRKELKTVTTRRYSPGYGDFALHHQHGIAALLNFDALGVRVNEHALLLPEKSVTAVVGIV